MFALLLVSSVTVGALSLARKTGRLAVRPHLPPPSHPVRSATSGQRGDRLRIAVISTRITRLSSTSEWRTRAGGPNSPALRLVEDGPAAG